MIVMEDPELQEIFDRFISNRNIEDSAKIQKLKQLLIVFSNRWAEERTISTKYRDKCYELLEYTDKSLKMVDKLKESLLHEQAKSTYGVSHRCKTWRTDRTRISIPWQEFPVEQL